MFTTLVAPPLLSLIAPRTGPEVDTARDRGVESLVSGTELGDLVERRKPEPPA
jgi:hypothetical protein